jgi:hypothetical protein
MFSDLARVWCRLLALVVSSLQKAANGRHSTQEHTAPPGFQLTAATRGRDSLEALGRRTQCIEIASGVCCVVETLKAPSGLVLLA